MSRIIKFRGLNDTNSWRYGYLGHNGQFSYIQTGIVSQGVKEETIGQFTGLLDSKGKEVYENDVVRVSRESYRMFLSAGEEGDKQMEKSEPLYLIVWNEKTCSFMTKDLNLIRKYGDAHSVYISSTCFGDKELEIIGNIYETKS